MSGGGGCTGGEGARHSDRRVDAAERRVRDGARWARLAPPALPADGADQWA